MYGDNGLPMTGLVLTIGGYQLGLNAIVAVIVAVALVAVVGYRLSTRGSRAA